MLFASTYFEWRQVEQNLRLVIGGFGFMEGIVDDLVELQALFLGVEVLGGLLRVFGIVQLAVHDVRTGCVGAHRSVMVNEVMAQLRALVNGVKALFFEEGTKEHFVDERHIQKRFSAFVDVLFDVASG